MQDTTQLRECEAARTSDEGSMGACLTMAERLKAALPLLLKGIRRGRAESSEAEVPERRDVREAVERLKRHMNKEVEVRYLDLGVQKISTRSLMNVSPLLVQLGDISQFICIDWDCSYAAEGRTAIASIRGADGAVLFERKDIPFDDSKAMRIDWEPAYHPASRVPIPRTGGKR
jgi:hypothetical protein